MIVSVLANGCFDLLHAGHVEHLREARAMGHWLVVALTVDEAVGKGPGRPVQTWEDRAAVLGALRFVDQIVPSTDAPSAIRKVRPRIFVKGADYAGADVLKPNHYEMQAFVGRWRDEADLEDRALGLIREHRIGAILMTRGERGMTLFQAGQVLSITGRHVELCDVSGAGDTAMAEIGRASCRERVSSPV